MADRSDDPFCVGDVAGTYRAQRAFSEDEIVALALDVLTHRLKRGLSFHQPAQVKAYLKARLVRYEREVFACLFLDNRHRLIAYEELFFGTIDNASVYPRELVKRALHHNACAVILAHNHPSGVAEPSNADVEITRRVMAILNEVDVRVLDHIIVGDSETMSFADCDTVQFS